MDKDTTKLELAKIIENKPNWIIQWGVTVLFLIVILVFIIWYVGLAVLLLITRRCLHL